MKTWLIYCFILFASPSTWCQGNGNIDRPTFEVGDSWTYQQTDLWKNDLQPGTKTIAVQKITADKVHFLGTNLDGSKLSYNANLDQNFQYKFKGNSYSNNEYSWPLTVGKSWKNDREYARGEADITLEEKCEVRALEKVEVPAGVFDTYLIACKSFFTNSLGGKGSQENLRWYAPTVKRHVKSQYRSWFGARLDSQFKDELTKYHLAEKVQ